MVNFSMHIFFLFRKVISYFLSDTSNNCTSQTTTGSQQMLKDVTAHPVNGTPFKSEQQFFKNVPTKKVHPSCSSYIRPKASLSQTRSVHISNVNDRTSTVACEVVYFFGALFLLFCIYHLKRSKFIVVFLYLHILISFNSSNEYFRIKLLQICIHIK